MRRPSRDPLRFGERGREELRVEPTLGRAGTQFHFKAFHFERRKSVRVRIEGPQKYVVLDHMLITDDNGSIGRDGFILTASGVWPLGEYTFSVDGVPTIFTMTR